jgi:hypothetical protein
MALHFPVGGVFFKKLHLTHQHVAAGRSQNSASRLVDWKTWIRNLDA